jgi:hypothetical protein
MEKVKIRHEHFEDGTNQTTITGGEEADFIFAFMMTLISEDAYELETVGVEGGEQDIEAA